MPERQQPKLHPHPREVLAGRRDIRRPGVEYAELAVTSNFTFLTGASHPEELVERAAELSLGAIAITDRNTLAGIVRAHVAADASGIPLVVGSRLEVGTRRFPGFRPAQVSVLAYPSDRAAYGGLCRLLTLGKRRAPKGECSLDLEDLFGYERGLLVALVVPELHEAIDGAFLEVARRIAAVFDDDRASLAISLACSPDDRVRLERSDKLARAIGVPLVATGDVHYHVRERRPLQDVITCIRHGTTLEAAGYRLFANAERHLKPPGEMQRLFAGCPRAITRTLEIAERASFRLDELRYQYPDEVCAPGKTPMQHLTDLTRRGASERYPGGVPARVQRQIDHELVLIDELQYAPYFLTVEDLVAFARSKGILCQGRGAAANSAVCYCLGVTAVDPDRIDVLFERFVSKERDEPPDIDIDFEHERREEVIQYIYGKYGRDRAALTAEVISYRARSASREVGKALGLSLDCVDRLAKEVDGWFGAVSDPIRLREIGLDPEDPTMQRFVHLANELLGFPRHLSQHVGGFVITQGPLSELVPIENAAMADRTVIEWDKDDIDAMGMLKVDCLGLGMLTCVRKALELVGRAPPSEGAAGLCPGLELHQVPPEDPAVYDMICDADTIGVFQIESRAQMSMLPRLKPRSFYDLVIEVAIVRPGPIQGDMVHPYLRRRNGEEPVSFPKEEVRRILGKTLGVPLFQEQAMSLAIVAGGFTPGEADQLRRAMAAWKRKGNQILEFGRKLISGMLARGYSRHFAEQCFRQIQGFSDYGFPESHAASFALIVYVSAWLKRYHPAAFAAALINSQPMGFYAPAQIVRDAEEHGVEVRALDVNRSGWDCALERADSPDSHGSVRSTRSGFERTHDWGCGGPALRLGMRLVKGLREGEGRAIAGAVRRNGPFESVEALLYASGVRVTALRRLASADAFGSMGLDRQAALWQVRALREEGPLFRGIAAQPEAPPRPDLPEVGAVREVHQDYASMHLSLREHPLAFLRGHLEQRRAAPCHELGDPELWPHGRGVRVAGIVLIRQRPATASGIVFMTVEDETGIANLIVWPKVFERFRRVARQSRIVLVQGRVERQGKVVHVVARELEGLDELLGDLAYRPRNFH